MKELVIVIRLIIAEKLLSFIAFKLAPKDSNLSKALAIFLVKYLSAEIKGKFQKK